MPVVARGITARSIDASGVTLLLGPKEAHTRLSWACLEGVVAFLAGRN